MKPNILFCAMLCSTGVMAQDKPDNVGGSAKADFINGELRVPCVLIEGLNDQTEGMYFDIILKRRGKSYNYELSTAQPEDAELCELIADYAEFNDDDFDDGDLGGAEIMAQCTVRPERNSISINAKELEDGDYIARVSSGENTIDSMSRAAIDGEVEFDFDSNAEAVTNGAEAIESDFIVDAAITAEILLDGSEDALLSSTVNCKVEEPEEEEEDEEEDESEQTS